MRKQTWVRGMGLEWGLILFPICSQGLQSFSQIQSGSFLHLMLILTVPAQFIAVVYQTYDFIFHIWNSSWNKAAVYCMFLFNEWISDKDSSCTISCHIVQVLCPAPHNSLCCRICKGYCLLVSVFFTNREWRFILLFKSTFFHSRENN